MARTAVPLQVGLSYMGGFTTRVDLTVGDHTNNHEFSLERAPDLFLNVINQNAASRSFTLVLPGTVGTFNKATTVPITVPGAVAGEPGFQQIKIERADVLKQSGNLGHIDSAELTDVYFALTAFPTTAKL